MLHQRTDAANLLTKWQRARAPKEQTFPDIATQRSG
jgi:hypothetical protein